MNMSEKATAPDTSGIGGTDKEMLYGSSIQPSTFKRPDYVDEATGQTVEGETVQLGTVVQRAFVLCGAANATEWNALRDELREAFIVDALRDMQLPVTHNATKVEVLGAGNMTLQQQADTIRLNPGVGGFSEEAHAQAAEDEKNGVPLPESVTVGELQDGALQGTSNAAASATGLTDAGNASPVDASNGNAEIAAQNQAAAASTAPEPEVAEGSAHVALSPAGDGWLVKFWDRVEKHFFATVVELEEALAGYDHNPHEAKPTASTGE